jgi:hypothetical protein
VKLAATARGSVRIEVHAKPRAKKSRVVGVHGDALSVTVAAPPVDGAANEELVRFLAELFDVAVGRVTLIRGTSGRMKLFEIDGTDLDAMRRALERHL